MRYNEGTIAGAIIKENTKLKWVRRIIIISTMAILLMSLGFEISDTSISVIFGVLGIIFPLACNQILSVSFSDVENQALVNIVRNKLSGLLKNLVYAFIASAVLYSEFYPDMKISIWIISFSIHGVARYIILFMLVYFAYNFLSIVQYRDEFEDSLRRMREEQEYKHIIEKTESLQKQHKS